MAHQTPPTNASRRWLVRALFVAVFLYFCAGEVLRKSAGEPFPALLMPSFAGIGLESMVDGRGTTHELMITVEFANGYTKRVSLTDFSPPEFFELTLPRKFLQSQSDDARALLRSRLNELFPGRKAVRITFRSCVVSFPLDRPKDRQTLEESETAIELAPTVRTRE